MAKEHDPIKTVQPASSPAVQSERAAMAAEVQQRRNAIQELQPPVPVAQSKSMAPPEPALDISDLLKIAVGPKVPGNRLFLVSLEGHKSRVIDPEKGSPIMVANLPVWARHDGAARDFFERVYHTGLKSQRKLEISEVPGTEIVALDEKQPAGK